MYFEFILILLISIKQTLISEGLYIFLLIQVDLCLPVRFHTFPPQALFFSYLNFFYHVTVFVSIMNDISHLSLPPIPFFQLLFLEYSDLINIQQINKSP